MDRKEFLRENWEKVVFFCIAVAGAVLDLLSKSAVFSSLGVVVQHDEKGSPFVRGERTIGLIGDTLSFRAAVNTGAVFSLFRGNWAFLVLFTCIALGIILWIIFRQPKGRPWTVFGFGFVCAGALGNLWDRIFFSGVRDFIDFKASFLESLGFVGGRWPTFNVADVWIVVGIGCIILGEFILYREGKEASVEGAGAEGEGGGAEPVKKKRKKKNKKH